MGRQRSVEQAWPPETELHELEARVVAALQARDDSTLNILGYGEISVALGWPISEPRFVCKRTPPFTQTQFADYRELVNEYITSLNASELSVVDTTTVPLNRGEQVIAFLVQPLLDSASLGQNVLKAAEPDADHPFLAALAKTLEVVTPELSVDAQVTNFSWDGYQLTLVDVGTPFLWDAAGTFRLDMKPFIGMFPAPTRPLVRRELTKLVTRWNDPRRVGIDIVANLYREGLSEWVDPMVVALNRQLPGKAISAEEARAFYDEDVKLWPLLKKLQAGERWWQTTVRRRPYDWFIYSSFE